MSQGPPTYVRGNLTEVPEMHFTPNGQQVCNITIADTPREFDRQTNQWKDGETIFMRGSVWGDEAANLIESAQVFAQATGGKKPRVIGIGHLVSRSFEHEGQKRTVTEMKFDEVALSVKFAKATGLVKSSGNGQNGGMQGNPQGAPAPNGQPAPQYAQQPQGAQPPAPQYAPQPQEAQVQQPAPQYASADGSQDF